MNAWLWVLLAYFIVAEMAALANPKGAAGTKVIATVLNGVAILCVFGAAGMLS